MICNPRHNSFIPKTVDIVAQSKQFKDIMTIVVTPQEFATALMVHSIYLQSLPDQKRDVNQVRQMTLDQQLVYADPICRKYITNKDWRDLQSKHWHHQVEKYQGKLHELLSTFNCTSYGNMAMLAAYDPIVKEQMCLWRSF